MEQNRNPRNEPTELEPTKFFHKRSEIIQGEKSVQQMVLRKQDLHMHKHETSSLPLTKINFQWIKDLALLPDTELLEENTRDTLQDTGRGKEVLEKTPEVQASKTNI